MQKNAKFSSAGGSAPRSPCLRRLGALPPNPQPSAAGGFAPRPPLVSGGWGIRPQTPKTAPPIANFWLRDWKQHKLFITTFLLVRENLKYIANRSDRIGIATVGLCCGIALVSKSWMVQSLLYKRQDDFLACSLRQRVTIIASE